MSTEIAKMLPVEPKTDDPRPAEPPAPSLDALKLFGGKKEIWLELRGEKYRLRITRRGRLILTK